MKTPLSPLSQAVEVPPSWLAAPRSRPGSKDAFGAAKQRNLSRSHRAVAPGSTGGDDDGPPPTGSVSVDLLPAGVGAVGADDRLMPEDVGGESDQREPTGGKAAEAAAALLCRAWSGAVGRWSAGWSRVGRTAERVVDYFWNGPPEDGFGAGGQSAGSYETHVLEESLQKVGALLAVGFGDAGAEIVAENIRKKGDLNPMVPGR